MSFWSAVLDLAPAVFWKHDDTSGTVAVDSSGNNRPGTYVGGPTLNQTSIIPATADPAVLFDTNKYCKRDHEAWMNAGAEFTAIFSARFTDFAAQRDVFGKQESWQMWVETSGKVTAYMYYSGWKSILSSIALYNDRGYLFGIRRKNGYFSIWINGVKRGELAVAGAPRNTSYPLLTGWSSIGAGRQYKGRGQGFAYWPTTGLTDQQMADLFTVWNTVGSPPTAPSSFIVDPTGGRYNQSCSFSWNEGTDPDPGTNLLYTAEYSTDNWQTYNTIFSKQDITEYVWDTSGIARTRCKIRIRSWDGTSYSADYLYSGEFVITHVAAPSAIPSWGGALLLGQIYGDAYYYWRTSEVISGAAATVYAGTVRYEGEKSDDAGQTWSPLFSNVTPQIANGPWLWEWVLAGVPDGDEYMVRARAGDGVDVGPWLTSPLLKIGTDPAPAGPAVINHPLANKEYQRNIVAYDFDAVPGVVDYQLWLVFSTVGAPTALMARDWSAVRHGTIDVTSLGLDSTYLVETHLYILCRDAAGLSTRIWDAQNGTSDAGISSMFRINIPDPLAEIPSLVEVQRIRDVMALVHIGMFHGINGFPEIQIWELGENPDDPWRYPTIFYSDANGSSAFLHNAAGAEEFWVWLGALRPGKRYFVRARFWGPPDVFSPAVRGNWTTATVYFQTVPILAGSSYRRKVMESEPWWYWKLRTDGTEAVRTTEFVDNPGVVLSPRDDSGHQTGWSYGNDGDAMDYVGTEVMVPNESLHAVNVPGLYSVPRALGPAAWDFLFCHSRGLYKKRDGTYASNITSEDGMALEFWMSFKGIYAQSDPYSLLWNGSNWYSESIFHWPNDDDSWIPANIRDPQHEYVQVDNWLVPRLWWVIDPNTGQMSLRLYGPMIPDPNYVYPVVYTSELLYEVTCSYVFDTDPHLVGIDFDGQHVKLFVDGAMVHDETLAAPWDGPLGGDLGYIAGSHSIIKGKNNGQTIQELGPAESYGSAWGEIDEVAAFPQITAATQLARLTAAAEPPAVPPDTPIAPPGGGLFWIDPNTDEGTLRVRAGVVPRGMQVVWEFDIDDSFDPPLLIASSASNVLTVTNLDPTVVYSFRYRIYDPLTDLYSDYSEIGHARPRGTFYARDSKQDFESNPPRFYHGTSLELRPDAISLNHLVAHAPGPVALGDPNQGLLNRAWMARADAATKKLYLARAGEASWDPEIELWDYSQDGGDPIDELDLAFEQNGRPVIAAQRGSELWIFFYNPTVPGYAFTQFGNGRTPRILLDDPIDVTDSDVLIFFIDGNSLYYRTQRDRYVSATQLAGFTVDATRYLEEAARLSEPRIAIVTSRRFADHGYYIPPAWVSKLYPYKPVTEALAMHGEVVSGELAGSVIVAEPRDDMAMHGDTVAADLHTAILEFSMLLELGMHGAAVDCVLVQVVIEILSDERLSMFGEVVSAANVAIMIVCDHQDVEQIGVSGNVVSADLS